MYNVQFRPSYSSTTPNQKVTSNNNNNNNESTPIITTSAASDSLAQTDAVDNMNYDTTPTLSFKQVVRKDVYYQQGQQDDSSWVVSTNVSTPSTVDSSSFNNSSGNNRQPSESNVSPTTTIDDETQQRHMQQLFDKKRRRRESHNAVERRRRDNINERIFELSTLLPERDASKNNKGTILRKSVDHIRLLHEKVNQYQQRVQELENMLDMYRMRWGNLNNGNSTTTNQQPLDLSGIQPHLHQYNNHQRE